MARDDIPAAARMARDEEWICRPPDFAALGEPQQRFSWLSPKVLWASRNNVLAGLIGDPTENARRAWVRDRVKALQAAGAPPVLAQDFTIERPDLTEFSALVIGDCGEGDVSQYAIIPQVLAAAAGTEFALFASDIVYPAGDVNEYVGKFFVPYAGYPRPIYGVPGNHDWLDGLAGFMRFFCGASPPVDKLEVPRHRRYALLARLVHRLFWRLPVDADPATLARAEELRGEATASGPAQPNMYFCIDTPQLRIVCVDTGILGRLDFEQGEWLRRVSAGPKPKLLVSGKPVYGNGAVSPRRILPPEGSAGSDDGASAGTLLEIVRDPANGYVGLINGDIHNYQRYPVRQPDGRVLQFICSGGGGAFMSATHPIGRIALDGVTEEDVVLFPTRGDSLRAFSVMLLRRLHRWLHFGRGGPGGSNPLVRGIPADQAAAIVARRHGVDDPRLAAVKVSSRSRLLAEIVYPRRQIIDPHRVSEILDWDEPPFYKHLLRIDVTPGRAVIAALAASGCEGADPVEFDRVEIDLPEPS